MKKKLLIIVLLVLATGTALYFYMYKEHRNVTEATADFTLTVTNLCAEFAVNDSLATLKYQDKVLQLTGKITNIELQSKSIVIDEKVFAAFDVIVPSAIKIQNQVTIKGRFLGYDDLLEEFKMDQVSLIE